MSHNYAGLEQFATNIVLPDDGDRSSALNYNTAYEGLANRTNCLYRICKPHYQTYNVDYATGVEQLATLDDALTLTQVYNIEFNSYTGGVLVLVGDLLEFRLNCHFSNDTNAPCGLKLQIKTTSILEGTHTAEIPGASAYFASAPSTATPVNMSGIYTAIYAGTVSLNVLMGSGSGSTSYLFAPYTATLNVYSAKV